MASQLRLVALSVPTNIVEGYGRRTKTEFSRFMDMARGSLAETEYLLEFSIELGYIKSDISDIQSLIEEVGKLLWSFQKKAFNYCSAALLLYCSTALLFYCSAALLL